MCADRIPVHKGSLTVWSATAKQDMMAHCWQLIGLQHLRLMYRSEPVDCLCPARYAQLPRRWLTVEVLLLSLAKVLPPSLKFCVPERLPKSPVAPRLMVRLVFMRLQFACSRHTISAAFNMVKLVQASTYCTPCWRHACIQRVPLCAKAA